jgi:LuxR family maltose regulon positive regulatory protein
MEDTAFSTTLTDAQVPAASVPTKSRPPHLPADTIARPRITACLLAGLAGPATLVCAPAGFGKTVALVAAAAASPWPVVWLAHAPADRSLTQFVRALVAAVQGYAADACRSTLSLLELPERRSPTALAQALEEDLDTLPDDCVVVIDDYHRISSAEIDFLMVALLERLPPQVHLLVASRTPPAWPLATLRAKGRLAEVEAARLRFTRAETRAFLARATHGPVDELTSATVQQQMGGWAAAVRLAALSLRQANGAGAALPSLARRAEPHAIQYLLDEVVAHLPPRVQAFLVRTAICGERVCPALADALLAEAAGVTDSTAVLQQLEEGGLFVVRDGDETGEWYRYHDLLRAGLEQRLRERYDAAEIRALHSRASTWFALAGQVEDTVRHALAAGEPEAAAAIVAAHIPEALERHQWALVADWLELLPTELVDERAALLLAAGWVAHRRMQYGRLTSVVEQVAAWLEQNGARLASRGAQAIEAELDALSAVTGGYSCEYQRAYDQALRAWERLPATAAHARGQTGCTLGIAAQALGQSELAARLLESDQGLALRAYPAATLHVWLAVLNAHFSDGDFAAAERTGSYIVRRAAELGLGFVGAWAHYLLGRVYYEWDQPAAAAEQFRAVFDLRHSAAVFALRGSLQGMALTNLALGQPPRSGLDNGSWQSPVTEGAWRIQEEVAQAFEARLALMQGDREAAFAWLRSTPPQPGSELANALEVPAITRVEVLLAEGGPAALATAAREVAAQLADYTARHDTIHVVPLLVLQALVAEARGDGALALAALERAVERGMPGGFVRSFVDRGPALAGLLAKLPPRADTRDYVDRLRAAGAPPADRRARPVPHREALLADLTEPLSARELEVLDLLARRFTNKEIANTLCLAWQTVAKHTANIYQKLRVSGRREAVERAAALGILPPDGGRAAGA